MLRLTEKFKMMKLGEIRCRDEEILDSAVKYDGVDPYFPFSSAAYRHSDKIDVVTWSKDMLDDIRSDASKNRIINPYNPSKIRPGGLAVWDRAVGLPACNLRKVFRSAFNARPVRNINEYTRKVLIPIIEKIRPVDGGWIRPKARYILDLPSNSMGYEILTMAEVMAQHEMIHVPDGPSISHRIRTWLARIHVAMEYGLDIFSGDWDWYSSGDMFPPYGIIVATGKDAGKPNAVIPLVDKGCPVPDKTVIVIGVGVSYGPPPTGFIDGTGNINEGTIYACTPTTSVISGWELVDVVTHMPILEYEQCYHLAYEDLQSPEHLDALLGEGDGVGDADSVDSFMEFYQSDLYRRLYANSAPHPPENSLIVKNMPEIGLMPPPGNHDIPPPDVTDEDLERKYKAWVPYITSLREIRGYVEKMSEDYERRNVIAKNIEGRTTGPSRKTRGTNFRKLAEKVKKRDNLVQKAKSAEIKGYLSKSREQMDKADKLTEEINAVTQ